MTVAEQRGRNEDGGSLNEQWRRARAEVRALGGQVAGITDELRELMRREVVLARTEAEENAGLATRGAIFGIAAALFAVFMLGFLGLALTFGLAEVLSLWLSALITAGVYLILGTIAGLLAKSRFDEFNLKPSHTLRSLREDMQWARAQIRRSAR
jgi:hypothetical protein